jgi:hypothetical protein
MGSDFTIKKGDLRWKDTPFLMGKNTLKVYRSPNQDGIQQNSHSSRGKLESSSFP